VRIDSYVAARAARKAQSIVGDWWLARTRPLEPVLDQAAAVPTKVDFETTNICNADCIFCAYQYQERPTGMMSLDLFRRLIRETAELGVTHVGFTPLVGDPLIDPHIVERVRLARDLGIATIHFYTNGILFKKVGAEALVTSGLTNLYLSTAGFDDASYRRIYRSTRYRQMYEGLVELLECNERMGHPIEVRLAIRSDEPMTAIRRKPDFQRIAHLIDGADAQMRFDSWSGRITADQLLPGMTLRPLPKKHLPCTLLYVGLTVLWDGQVTACGCRDLDAGSDLLLGNAAETPLADLWASAKLALIRRAWLDDEQIPAICRDCTHYTPATTWLRPENRAKVERTRRGPGARFPTVGDKADVGSSG
jgi:MoaA/NifB/PqqE/SkfB family radical SAM enzyme